MKQTQRAIEQEILTVNLRLSKDELQDIRRLALDDGRSLNATVREVLAAYAKHRQADKATRS